VGQQEQVYSRFVEALELGDLCLVDLKYHADAPIRGPVKITHNVDITKEDHSSNQIIAVACFELRGHSEGIERMSIEMRWRLEYRLQEAEGEGFTEDLANRFLERNVFINIWPFIRETVASLTAKMGRQPLVLPLLKIKR
jgi:preprotein translocase subunit SecB